jgi:hypothetical protein
MGRAELKGQDGWEPKLDGEPGRQNLSVGARNGGGTQTG